MKSFRNYIWNQSGIDLPRYKEGELKQNPRPYIIERPHGQDAINMDLLLKVLLESEKAGEKQAFRQALIVLKEFNTHRSNNDTPSRVPDFARRWIIKRLRDGRPPLSLSDSE